MKNKIIAVLTACCMICGAFSLNIIDTVANTINASAVEASEYETRYGKICYDVYSSGSRFFCVSKLDSSYYYEGDPTSDIDWSKYKAIFVSDSHISTEWSKSEKDIVIKCETYVDYHNDKIIISFEDMDFLIEVQCRFITTTADRNWYTTTSTNTTITTATAPPPTTRPTTTMPTTTMPTTTMPTTTMPATTTEYPWWLFTTTSTYTTKRPTTTTTTTTTTPVPSLKIIPSSVNMKTGDTNKLAIIGVSDISDVMWTSEDTSVATVSENGTVTAKGAGSTMIYAVYNGNVASCTIKVKGNDSDNTVYGDSNEDGSINMADVTAIIQHIGNKDAYALSEQGIANADTNGDGQVTGVDALIIQKIIANEITISDLPYNE